MALAGSCWLLAGFAEGQSFNVLHTFSGAEGQADGGNPSSLLLASNGQFYGTCVNQGLKGWGDIYHITAAGTLTPVYSFTNAPAPYDGTTPYAALAQGTNGLLYGMAQAGGSNGVGTIFDLKTNGSFSSPYSFSRVKGPKETNSDGMGPFCALALNTNNGNFYGTAESGGANGYGTVFQVTHQGKMTVLYAFSNLLDGGSPQAPLMLFTNGCLYGTAAGGGSNGFGTVFQISAVNAVKPIYSFTNGLDGAEPQGILVNGRDGFLYGTCSAGGSNGTGSIYKITTNGVLTALYSFGAATQYPGTGGVQNQYNADGINPKDLVLGSDGSFYGVAFYGGPNGSGSVYQYSQSAGFNLLYGFSYSGGEPNSDGANPLSLAQHTNGNFYGTAYTGGSNGFGAFFTIGLPPSITTQPANQSIAMNGAAAFQVASPNSQSCQWQFNGADLPNATNNNLTIASAHMADAGWYQAVLSNLNGVTLSAAASLNLTNVAASIVSGAGAVQYADGQFSIVLTNLTGQDAVIIEASSNLIQWTPICTNPPGFGTAQFFDSAAGSFSRRYYRVATR